MITPTRYYIAARPDGTDFHTGTVDYAAALTTGEVLTHPNPVPGSTAVRHYFSASTAPTDCTGAKWPCLLYVIEPVGATWAPHLDAMPHKVACVAVRVVEEVPAIMALGPQGAEVVALIERSARLSGPDIRRLGAAWDAARGAAWDAVWEAAWDAARGAAWNAVWEASWDAASDAAREAAWDAARDAAAALVVRDLIGQYGFAQEHYDTLSMPWRTTIGPIHPDDEDTQP